MDGKQCFKCKRVKPKHLFYSHPMMGDGLLGKCKACTKKDVRENRKKRLDYYRKYDRVRAKIRGSDQAKKRRIKYPGKYKARTAVSKEIRSGLIERLPCEVCGELKVHAHHEDYRKPLEVRWLCMKHHWKEHGVDL